MPFRYSPIFYYTVRGNSMEPTLRAGMKIWVNRFYYNFKRPRAGDLILACHPYSGIPVVKRIQTIIGKKLFLIGDNATKSTDSRHFGPLNKKVLLGKIIQRSIP